MGCPRVVAVTIGTLLIAASLSGCGKHYWGKPGASQQQFERDNAECAKESAPTPSAVAYGIVYERLYRACLATRGWTREQHVNPPPGWYRGIE